MKDENNLYWVWLADKFGVASKIFPEFVGKYPDPYDVYRLSAEEIEYTEGISSELKARLGNKSLESAYTIIKYCREHKIRILTYGSSDYPKNLMTIENPPIVLYCMGKLPNTNDMLTVSIVGTRKMSEYGKQAAYKLSYELASANAIIVSGMALGIDGVSACGAISAGGKTIAVLGSGFAKIYPKQHEKLMRIIAQNGAVLTEYPPFESPDGRNFPIRNRIISGLGKCVVVIEGARGSGALITASRAIDQGRELFALPGKINESNSDGPNELLRNGANAVLSADDIIEYYDFLYHNTINYGKFAKSKKSSGIDEEALERMGVCSACYKKQISVIAREGKAVVSEKKEPKNAEAPERSGASPDLKITDEVNNTAYETLDDVSKKVYDAMLTDKNSTPDEISSASGVAIGDVITALTMLEISGLVLSAPGGTFKKK